MRYILCMKSGWRNQMETFFALLALCEGNPPVTSGFLTQRPVTRGFDVFFDLCLNKRLSKHSRHRWFETPSRSLWRHCSVDDSPYSAMMNNTLIYCINCTSNLPPWTRHLRICDRTKTQMESSSDKLSKVHLRIYNVTKLIWLTHRI